MRDAMLTIYQASCAHEQDEHWPAVGTVDGRGHDGQQTDAICDAHGPYQTIQSAFKPVFRRLRLIGYTYKLPRLLSPRFGDLGDFRGDNDRQTDRQIDCFTPVHARRVTMLLCAKDIHCKWY